MLLVVVVVLLLVLVLVVVWGTSVAKKTFELILVGEGLVPQTHIFKEPILVDNHTWQIMMTIVTTKIMIVKTFAARSEGCSRS